MSQIRIPVNYVPRAFVDFDAEARQILGQDLVLSDGFRVPPLTAARLVALEIVSSRFFLDPEGCDLIDAAAAVVILFTQHHLMQKLLACRISGTDGLPSGLHDYPELESAAASWLAAHADALQADYSRLVDWICTVPFYGFLMRPGSTGRPKEFIFDGEYIGAVVAPASRILATPVEMVLWETPLCLVGHAVAQHDASLGVKGVERPPDRAEMKRLMAEAAARESRGELHPWQYQDPIHYPITDTQVRSDPSIIGRFARIRQIFEKNGGQPVDPAEVSAAEAASLSACAPDAAGGDSIAVSGSTFASPAGNLHLYVSGFADARAGELPPVVSAARADDCVGAGACTCGMRDPSEKEKD